MMGSLVGMGGGFVAIPFLTGWLGLTQVHYPSFCVSPSREKEPCRQHKPFNRYTRTRTCARAPVSADGPQQSDST